MYSIEPIIGEQCSGALFPFRLRNTRLNNEFRWFCLCRQALNDRYVYDPIFSIKLIKPSPWRRR